MRVLGLYGVLNLLREPVITGVPYVVTKAWDEAELMAGLLDKTHKTPQTCGCPPATPKNGGRGNAKATTSWDYR